MFWYINYLSNYVFWPQLSYATLRKTKKQKNKKTKKHSKGITNKNSVKNTIEKKMIPWFHPFPRLYPFPAKVLVCTLPPVTVLCLFLFINSWFLSRSCPKFQVKSRLNGINEVRFDFALEYSLMTLWRILRKLWNKNRNELRCPDKKYKDYEVEIIYTDKSYYEVM